MALTEKEAKEVSEHLTKKLEEINSDRVDAFQQKLDLMELEGRKAQDSVVRDLELWKIESERKVQEQQNALFTNMKDEIRQLEGQLATSRLEIERLGAFSDLRPGDRGYNPDFKGCFVADVPAVRQMVRDITVGMSPQTRVVTSGTTIATAGKLPDDVADTFIDNLVALQPTLNVVQTRRMSANLAHLDELITAARSLRLATEGTAPSDTNAFTAGRRTLTAVESIWAEDITLSFLEDNIEKRNAEAHIAAAIARGVGNDLNDLFWNGDGSTAGFLIQNKGVFQILTDDSGETTYTATSDVSATAVLQGMHKAMPAKYKGRTDLTYFVPIPFAEHYLNEVSVRETTTGDAVLLNGFTGARYFGRPIVADSHLSSAASSNAKAILTPAPNLVFGIQRNITVDSMWQPRTRKIEYTVTVRADFQIAVMDGVVATVTIPAALQ